ncbi:AAA family ATPase [Clostridium sp. P21]|uniref:AAA family ATPase n=1 Tax=Clostridium muellerianum TaxID=2716538 RepID=A0A7Y0HMJ5_9CLOT|nr:TniB family NTP-binding protein [Clostridium muellerianum]NMM62235.1 AAA family ATPase [Clostridium muellerianum]
MESIDKAREAKEFAQRIANIHIHHSKIEKIYNKFMSMRCFGKFGAGGNNLDHLFIIGKSGVGKSNMVKKYAEQNPGYTKVVNGIEYDIKPVVYLELPDPFTILELYQSIVKALGAPQRFGRPSIGEVKRQAFNLLEKQEVEMLILDEMNYILSSKYVKPQEAMEAIKHIGNQANISLVCIGTPEIECLRKLSFQYFRRFPQVELERFTQLDKEFCLFLKAIEEQIRPEQHLGLGDMDTLLPEMFFKMSKGVVSIITQTIQEAYRLAGVYDTDFNDVSKININVGLLYVAYKNIVGDMMESDFENAVEQT